MMLDQDETTVSEFDRPWSWDSVQPAPIPQTPPPPRQEELPGVVPQKAPLAKEAAVQIGGAVLEDQLKKKLAEEAAKKAATQGATQAAASGAAGSMGASVAGPLAGGAVSLAQGNTKGAIGSTVGGILGSYFGPIGTVAGSALGNYLATQYLADGSVSVQPTGGKDVASSPFAPQVASSQYQDSPTSPIITNPMSHNLGSADPNRAWGAPQGYFNPMFAELSNQYTPNVGSRSGGSVNSFVPVSRQPASVASSVAPPPQIGTPDYASGPGAVGNGPSGLDAIGGFSGFSMPAVGEDQGLSLNLDAFDAGLSLGLDDGIGIGGIDATADGVGGGIAGVAGIGGMDGIGIGVDGIGTDGIGGVSGIGEGIGGIGVGDGIGGIGSSAEGNGGTTGSDDGSDGTAGNSDGSGGGGGGGGK